MNIFCLCLGLFGSAFCLSGACAGTLVDVTLPGRTENRIEYKVRYRTSSAHDYTWLYHSLGTKARESGCPCLPSCSAYGPQAVAKHGLLGVAMMVDRFLRESEDMGSVKWVRTGKDDKLFDPVEDNDYWYYDKVGTAGNSSYYARELVREWTGNVSVNR